MSVAAAGVETPIFVEWREYGPQTAICDKNGPYAIYPYDKKTVVQVWPIITLSLVLLLAILVYTRRVPINPLIVLGNV